MFLPLMWKARPPTEFTSLFRCRILELRADCIALGAEPIDFGFPGANLGIEREQFIEVEIHAFVADRALNRLAIGLDEFPIRRSVQPGPLAERGAAVVQRIETHG